MDVVSYEGLDEVDNLILTVLQQESQLSNVDLARRINLSPPATHARVKRLEQEGYIERYAVVLNKEKLGFDLLCYVFISTNMHQVEQLDEFEGTLYAMPQVLECVNLTGEYDYMLKVVLRNREDLQKFVRKLTLLPNISRLHTNVTMKEIKSTTALPVTMHEPES